MMSKDYVTDEEAEIISDYIHTMNETLQRIASIMFRCSEKKMSDNDLRKQVAEAKALVRGNTTSMQNTSRNSASLSDPVRSTFT